MNRKYGPGICVGLGLLIACASAAAQSSVTLYGLIENGIDYYNNSGGHSAVVMRDGVLTGLYGSRWGLAGAEDLGNGVKAIFKLENGFGGPTGALGQGGLEFGRQAFVGLATRKYGTLTVGRQYDSIVDYLQFAGTGAQWGGITTHASDIDNLQNSFRINDAIKYTSPLISGLQVGGLYAFSNTNAVGGSGTTAAVSAGGSYSYGPFKGAIAYFHAKHPATLLPDGHYLANTVGSAIGSAGPWSYVGHPDTVTTLGAGGTYAFGRFSVGTLYTRVKFTDANGTQSNVVFDDYDISLNYAITPLTRVGVGYLYTAGYVDYLNKKPEYHRIALGVDTKLSRRTEVYAVFVVQQAAGDAKGADLYQGSATNMSTTGRAVGARVALVHRF